MTYDEAVALSAERSRTNPMTCRCGAQAFALYGGSSFCNNGVCHYECRSCGRHWDSTRDWTEADWDDFRRRVRAKI